MKVHIDVCRHSLVFIGMPFHKKKTVTTILDSLFSFVSFFFIKDWQSLGQGCNTFVRCFQLYRQSFRLDKRGSAGCLQGKWCHLRDAAGNSSISSVTSHGRRPLTDENSFLLLTFIPVMVSVETFVSCSNGWGYVLTEFELSSMYSLLLRYGNRARFSHGHAVLLCCCLPGRMMQHTV